MSIVPGVRTLYADGMTQRSDDRIPEIARFDRDVAAHDIIVIGASAGGVMAIRRLLSMLPSRMPAALFVALHRAPSAIDSLSNVLTRHSSLPAHGAFDGDRIRHGEVFVAPPDMHLVVERGVTRLERSPRENHTRPSIDALFRSAAMAYGRRVVGVLLSGLLTDGSIGLWQIRKRGGIAIGQDPAEAEYADMPRHAREEVPLHYCLPLIGIAAKLIDLASERPSSPTGGTRSARVLVVEDERLVAMNLENRLRDLSYHVVGSVATGEAALDVAPILMPDIVLMDVYLAGPLKGTAAAKLLWERYQLPVIYLTAHADDATVNEAKQSTPYGYIVKPYRPEQIHAAIQLALDRYEREMAVGAAADSEDLTT